MLFLIFAITDFQGNLKNNPDYPIKIPKNILIQFYYFQIWTRTQTHCSWVFPFVNFALVNANITAVETQSINLLRLSKSLLCLVSCIHNTALLIKAFLTDSLKVKCSTDQVDLSPFTVKPSLIFYFLNIWYFLPDPESNSKIQTLQKVLLFLKVISVHYVGFG